jgi:hypothetical protein
MPGVERRGQDRSRLRWHDNGNRVVVRFRKGSPASCRSPNPWELGEGDAGDSQFSRKLEPTDANQLRNAPNGAFLLSFGHALVSLGGCDLRCGSRCRRIRSGATTYSVRVILSPGESAPMRYFTDRVNCWFDARGFPEGTAWQPGYRFRYPDAFCRSRRVIAWGATRRAEVSSGRLSAFRVSVRLRDDHRLFHGEHFGSLLTERPLLRNAGPAWKASGGLPDLTQQNDVALPANRIVAFNESPQHQRSILESSSFDLISPAPLQNRSSAYADQGQKEFGNRRCGRHGAAGAARKVLA